MLHNAIRDHEDNPVRLDGLDKGDCKCGKKDIYIAKGMCSDCYRWAVLYDSVNEMVAKLGVEGEISTRSDEVSSVMDALHNIDGGTFKPMTQ
jgi:hypothetical protein